MKRVFPFVLSALLLVGCGASTEQEVKSEQENTSVEASIEISLEEKKEEEKTAAQGDNSTQEVSEDTGLIGKWYSYVSSGEYSIEFFENGTAIIHDFQEEKEATYEEKGVMLFVTDNSGEITRFQYSNGGLTSEIDGAVFTKNKDAVLKGGRPSPDSVSPIDSSKQASENDKAGTDSDKKDSGIIGKWYPSSSEFKVYYMQIDEGGVGTVHRDDEVFSLTYTFDGNTLRVVYDIGGSRDFYYEDGVLLSDVDGDIYSKKDASKEATDS